MIQLLVIHLPDFTKSFVIECDALRIGIGAILMKDSRHMTFSNQALKD